MIFSEKIFGIFGLKSSKLRRFFDFWKWAEDEDEDGSSAKNLRRTKIFEASLQHWSRHRPSDLEETELVGNIWLVTISQCVNYFQTLIEVTRSVTSQNIVASLTTEHWLKTNSIFMLNLFMFMTIYWQYFEKFSLFTRSTPWCCRACAIDP